MTNAEMVTPELLARIKKRAWKRGRYRSMAEELFSVGESAVAVKLSRFDGRMPFDVWAWKTADYAMIDYLREVDVLSRRDRMKLRSGITEGLHYRNQVSDDVLQYIPEEAKDPGYGKELPALLAKMDPILGFVLAQRFLHEKRLQDIAYFLDLTEARIAQLVAEALPILKRLYLKAA